MLLLPQDALRQNPESMCPPEIQRELRVLEVLHQGFDRKLHTGQIVVHNLVTKDVSNFFRLAWKLKFPIRKIIPISQYNWDDVASCEDNNSSGYNFRRIAATGKLSKHAIGCAFDINPFMNVYIRYDENGKEIDRLPHNGEYEPFVPGTLTADHPLVEFMIERGWTWGGNWTPDSGRVDYQHFEIVPPELAHYVQ